MSTPPDNMSGYVDEDGGSLDAPRVKVTAQKITDDALADLERRMKTFGASQPKRKDEWIPIRDEPGTTTTVESKRSRGVEAVKARVQRRAFEAREKSISTAGEGRALDAAVGTRQQNRTLEIRNKSVSTIGERSRDSAPFVRSKNVTVAQPLKLNLEVDVADATTTKEQKVLDQKSNGSVRPSYSGFPSALPLPDSDQAVFPKKFKFLARPALHQLSEHTIPLTSTETQAGVHKEATGTMKPQALRSSSRKIVAPSISHIAGPSAPPANYPLAGISSMDQAPRLGRVPKVSLKPFTTSPITMPSQPVTDTTAPVSGIHIGTRPLIVSSSSVTPMERSHKPIEKGDVASQVETNVQKKAVAPISNKKISGEVAQNAKPTGNGTAATHEATSDDGFAIVPSNCPSATNGSCLPDPNVVMDELEEEFSSSLESFEGWDDDDASDDDEEWDMGGLAEWKWIGEKSAKVSSPVKGKAKMLYWNDEIRQWET